MKLDATPGRFVSPEMARAAANVRSKFLLALAAPRWYWLAGTAVCMVVLAACGDGGPPSSPSATSTVESQAPAEISPAAEARPPANATPDGASDELTLGELADRVNARLSEITAYREINVASVGTAGQPPAGGLATPLTGGEGVQRTTREVIAPDRVRITVDVDGTTVDEQTVVGNAVYARGFLAHILDPSADQDEWIVTDLDTISANPILSDTAPAQLSGVTPARYAVPDRLRPQVVRPLGEIEVDGRACEGYGAADTTSTGARIDITITVDEDDLLCAIDIVSSAITGRYTVEALEDGFAIEAPVNARHIATPHATPAPGGTPVSAAPSAAATPTGRS